MCNEDYSQFYCPSSCTLSLPYSFTGSIKKLPLGCKIINFGNLGHYHQMTQLKYNINFDMKKLPDLTHLSLSNYFNGKLPKLPDTLTHLFLGNQYDQPINWIGGTNLLNLEFGNKFNQPVDNLSQYKKLSKLVFFWVFNQPINNLPDSITCLVLSEHFNQPIYKLPKNLENLYLGNKFSHGLHNFPENLKRITTRYKWLHKHKIPECVEKIYILFDIFDNVPIDNLPLNITQIIINDKNKIHLFKKIPWGCKIFDEKKNLIL
jgi:hypothetical protein